MYWGITIMKKGKHISTFILFRDVLPKSFFINMEISPSDQSSVPLMVAMVQAKPDESKITIDEEPVNDTIMETEQKIVTEATETKVCSIQK